MKHFECEHLSCDCEFRCDEYCKSSQARFKKVIWLIVGFFVAIALWFGGYLLVNFLS